MDRRRRMIAGLGAHGVIALFGIVLGHLLAFKLIDLMPIPGNVVVDGWRTSTLAGAADADPLTRAKVAKVGLLALNHQETVYFIRGTDETGQPLDSACSYRIEGKDLPARWWSLTLYAEDHYLAMNTDNAHSVDASSVARSEGGTFEVIAAGRQPDARNWLSTAGSESFDITMRLYRPSPRVIEEPTAIAMPSITKLECEAS